jgi:hypothetical protein
VEEFVAPVRSSIVESYFSPIGADADMMKNAPESMITPAMGKAGIAGVAPGKLGGKVATTGKAGVGGGATPLHDLDDAANAIDDVRSFFLGVFELTCCFYHRCWTTWRVACPGAAWLRRCLPTNGAPR